ncbi:GDSL-type esterase/lipase family protein [Isachenkonia alkalipeptolytica]|nr:GDSL-type esterase/lipase family protein [Isachenkonia alkalipeptolytica]
MLKFIKNYLWPVFLVLFIIGSGFFIFGVYNSFQVVSGEVSEEPSEDATENEEEDFIEDPLDENDDEETTEVPGEDAEEIREDSSEGLNFISLGDSLARGTGDDEGLGFSGRVVENLRDSSDEPITYNNFAVDGFQSPQLLELFENPDLMEEIEKADIIFLSIGGNDLRRIQNLAVEEQERAYESLEEMYFETLEETFRLLRGENPEALVIFLGLYNLDYSEVNQDETEFLLRWNAAANQWISLEENAVFIPTYDLFQFQLETFLSFDGLHPNDEGYEAIAQRIIDVLPSFD